MPLPSRSSISLPWRRMPQKNQSSNLSLWESQNGTTDMWNNATVDDGQCTNPCPLSNALWSSYWAPPEHHTLRAQILMTNTWEDIWITIERRCLRQKIYPADYRGLNAHGTMRTRLSDAHPHLAVRRCYAPIHVLHRPTKRTAGIDANRHCHKYL